MVDDDLHLRNLVRTYAEMENFQCVEAENAGQALEAARSSDFDMIILDVMMPGRDGFDLLEELRTITSAPVVMLTARSEEYDRLRGFRLGADDYVPKPFSPKELMARVNAILKRVGRPDERILQFGGLCIQIDARIVTAGEQTITLSPKEFDLLVKLAQNEKIVLNRQQLLDSVWGYSYSGETRTVDTHIKSLREHLGQYRKYINTVWGVGYQFECKE